jgi:phosphatidylserine/phosphatidylglycerophosphate/cardiolipin synthase-like enzyme
VSGLRVLGRVDAAVGGALEAATAAYHGRRLRHVGWGHALDPPGEGRWAVGDPPPREGNALEVLIDGSEAFPALVSALQAARSHIHIAGWHVAPHFGLEREPDFVAVRDLFGQLAERVEVRVLLWAGAPLRVFHPTRREVRETRDALCRGTRVRCALDARESPMHAHHEKTIVIDNELAFVGGIDITDLAGDRYDMSAHPVRDRLGWHDVTTRLHGPAVSDVAAHFALRWLEVTGEQLSAPGPVQAAGGVAAQILRTVPAGEYRRLPRGDYGILEAYVRALRSARRLVYLENQFLWSPEIVRLLAAKLRRPPSDEFRLVTLLPGNPNNGADDTRGQLAVLADADDGAGRFLAATVRSRSGSRTGALYVHAKVAVVDDEWLTVGSANLNERSLFHDSEVNVASCEPALARDTRERLWAEHLERPRAAVRGDPVGLIDEIWKPIAAEQLERARAGAPATHRLIRLPGVSKRTARLRGPLQGLLEDI